MQKKIHTLAFFILLFLIPSLAHAATVILIWEYPNPPANIGYKIYYGTTEAPPYSGTIYQQGISPLSIGNVLTYTMNRASPATGIDYFALTAYYIDDPNCVSPNPNSLCESTYSNVVTVDWSSLQNDCTVPITIPN